jgi:phospholipase C
MVRNRGARPAARATKRSISIRSRSLLPAPPVVDQGARYMKSFDLRQYLLLLGATSLLLNGCNQGMPTPSVAPASRSIARAGRAPSGSPIQHVVVVIQENRTFNDFFATYPGADGTTKAEVLKVNERDCQVYHGIIHLKEMPLVLESDLNHEYQAFHIALSGGSLQGFDKINFQHGKPECKTPYQYTNPAQIKPYWSMAQQYVLAEHMYSSQGSNSFTAHQDLIRGSTNISPTYALVNDPTEYPWGCDAPPGTKTSLIDVNNNIYPGQGPFPCTADFPTSDAGYKTLRDLLDAKNVTWKYYTPPLDIVYGKLLTAFDVIASVRYGPEWQTNVVEPPTQIFTDIRNNTLPNVSWVIPDKLDSDHPGTDPDNGPSWVASIVNAIGESPSWGSTAIIIVWDDWGGLYDNRVGTQKYGFGGLGLRVPAIIVSPYAKAGFIAKTNYEFGSILKYIEVNWRLGKLGTSDVRAQNLINCFNYHQTPINFVPIPSARTKEYFIHRKPSLLPVDDDM